MAAKLEQMLGAGGKAFVEMESWHAARGPCVDAWFFFCGGEYDRGAVELFNEARGDDADDAGVPVFACCDGTGHGAGVLFKLSGGFFGDAALHVLAFVVVVAHSFGERTEVAFCIVGEKREGIGGFIESAAGVDAGRDAKGDVGGFDGFFATHERCEDFQAGTRLVVNETEAFAHEDAVVIGEWHEVCNGGDGDEIEELTLMKIVVERWREACQHTHGEKIRGAAAAKPAVRRGDAG